MERKLTAILSADVKGYSRLMGEDEEATIRTLTAYRQVMATHIQQQRGRVVDSPGDNLLAEFASVVDAVRCAVEIQHELKTKNAELLDHRQMQFRIGINLGDVVVEGERIYGDGVNIAARVEGLAEPGGICISGAVYEQVKTKLTLSYEYLGEQAVKNITEPVRVWRVVMDDAAAALAAQARLRPLDSTQDRPAQQRPVGATYRTWAVVVVAGLVLLVGGIMTVRYLAHPPFSPQSSALSTEAAPAALPLPDKPSLVVLPFVNMSGDPEQEYFSDGITEDITADLSKLSGFFVIARNSAFTYKGKAVKVQDVSREMGVRYVLEGSVRKAGEQVRVTAQLIDGPSGGHVWSERYNRPLTDIFAVQDEIVQQLVTTLQVEVQEAELERVRRIPTTNLTAYDSFLRGVEHLQRIRKEEVPQARRLFEQAIALDPSYALAYVALGGTYWEESHWSPDPQHLERALALAQQALALDDSLAVAHSLLSLVFERRTQSEQAIAEGERAVALDPNNASSAAHLGEVLNYEGRPVEAIGWLEKAIRLDPGYPFWFPAQLGWAYRLTGRYAEAIAAQKQAILRYPNEGPYAELAGNYVLLWAFQLSSDPKILEQALAAAQQAVALNASFWITHVALGSVYLWQQQYEQAVVEMERAVALYPTQVVSYAVLAEVLSLMGRADKALRVAEQGLRLRSNDADFHLLPIGSVYALAGRYEEAQASLQQFLRRYPEFLGAHLALAGVYSELGKEAEARAEAAEVLRLNPQFSLEVHKQRAPIKDPAVLERHLAALRNAGLK